MAERQWTAEQNNAINARGGTLLLSAAAGSGKTAVLVERIIKLMTQGNEPVEPGQLLVVTFTNAAAAEMRARVNDSVDDLIRNNPSDNFYRNIKMKLPEAKITTMDAFCIGFVRENFHLADIEPDFTMLDNSEQQILISEAMNSMLEKLCNEMPEIYDKLNTVTSYYGDDNSLTSKILRLYNYSLSHPFPSKWLNEIEMMYNSDGDIKQSVWGRTIIDEVLYTTEYCISLIGTALAEIPQDEIVENLYSADLQTASKKLHTAYEIISNGSWDEIYDYLSALQLSNLPKAPSGYGQNPTKQLAENQYKLAQKLMGECIASVCADTKGHNDDMQKLRPVIKGLVWAVREFKNNYDELKSLRNSYTFTDIMHRALSLLAKEENGEIKKTSLAYDLQETFREILIDEYQDTNEAQDMLFAMLSRNNNNMFMVGDVKQSIYRFRLAMPEIFVKKSREYTDFDNENYPAKIILGKNFRSRKGILDNINFLFKNIMSDYVGEMDYTDKDALYFGGGYPEDKEPAVELRLLKNKLLTQEADYIASLIEKMVRDGVTVQEKNGTRKAKYGDFCILLRSTKGKTDVYENALKQKGINVSCEKKTGLFSATETGVFTALLKVINNPTDDVAMLSVMFSPLYGFNADEAAQIKLYGKHKNLYSCLKDAANDMKKTATLLHDLSYYRRMSAITPVDVFVRTLLDITGYLSIVSALENGECRRMNLLMLCSLAADYASKGGVGIGGFIRFLNKTMENGTDIAAASDASADSDVVKILSIHKSKGLEFPFVILADCAKQFNTTDTSAEMIISSATGIGIKITNSERLQRYSTLGHAAAKLAVKRATVSEEMRILYVAMTRARERFIAVCSTAKPDEQLRAAVNSLSGQKPSPCAVLHAGSYMKWLLMGFIRHPDMREVLSEAGCFTAMFDYKSAESRLNVVVDEVKEIDIPEQEQSEKAQPDNAIIELIKQKTEFVYPYIIPKNARPKRVASDFEEKHFNAEYFAMNKPSFMCEGNLNPAEIGTANHLFLQNLDFNSADINSEIKRMTDCGILNKPQAAAIRIDKVKEFINSEIFYRIKNASDVLREKEFTVQVRLGDIDSTVCENVSKEKILVLGKADLVFIENGEAVVVDYKTDRTKTPDDFRKAYSGQLDMYRRAMEQILDLPVKEALIYSLELGETILVYKNNKK